MVDQFADDIAAIESIDAVPKILDVVCRVTGMGFAAVARVTEDRWIACKVLDKIEFGLKPGGELVVETTICNDIRERRQAVVINHVAESDTFRNHHTPAQYGFQSYISVPIIRKNGTFFGTLCAIDPRPARLENPETVGMFTLFAELIATQLDASDRLASIREQLAAAQELGQVREQFIAVLGHDLRSPVAAIAAGANMILRDSKEPKTRNIASLMRGSVLRMTSLISDVLDFARVRLGDGFTLDLAAGELKSKLDLVIAEQAAVRPDRKLRATIDIQEPVVCDHDRVAQLFANLLSNALAYGDEGKPVKITARTTGRTFVLSVSNAGACIPPERLDTLFKPFVRGDGKGSSAGLGLGLYIASEIAQAHGGRIEAASDTHGTTFTFRMPLLDPTVLKTEHIAS